MKLLTLLAALAGLAAAQDANVIQTAIQRALTPNTAVLTVTASQGDGSSIVLTKSPGNNIDFTARLTNAGTSTATMQPIRGTSTAPISYLLDAGDALCLLVVNGTSAAVAMGSVGNVAANSLAWSCSTNIRNTGQVTGQTALVSGSVSWP